MPRSAATSSYGTSARWTESEARAALSALDASGLSVLAFARRERLDFQRLYSWRRKLAGGGRPAFVEIRTVASRERIEIVLSSGLVVRVPESVEPAVVRRLVDALESPRTSVC